MCGCGVGFDFLWRLFGGRTGSVFVYLLLEGKEKKNDKMEVCVLVGWRVNIMRCYSLVYRGVNDARILLQ